MNTETIDVIKYIATNIIYVSGLVIAYRETLKYLKLKAAEKSLGATKVKQLEERFVAVDKRFEHMEEKVEDESVEVKQLKTELKEVRSDVRELMSDIKNAFFGKK
jgi:hypothetical protein